MAKRKTNFLDSFGEVLADDTLADLIPGTRPQRKNPKTPSLPNPRKKAQSPKRRKSFLDTIGEALQEDPEGSTIPQKKITPTEKKGFLSSLEDVLKDNALDQVMPFRPRNRRRGAKVPEKPLQTTIESEILDKVRKVAESKGIRIKDIINQALKRYVASESA